MATGERRERVNTQDVRGCSDILLVRCGGIVGGVPLARCGGPPYPAMCEVDFFLTGTGGTTS